MNSSDSYLDSESIKELRENARYYKKLSFMYIAAGGAVVAWLKLSGDSLLELSARVWVIVVVFAVVFAFDTFVEQMLFSEWLAEKNASAKRRTASKIANLIGWQQTLHFFFVIGVVLGALGFAMGSTSVKDRIKAMGRIQTATELFLYSKSRIPDSMDELIKAYPYIEDLYKTIGEQPIQFRSDPKERYRILFSGEDALFGTKDDEEVTSLVKISDYMDKDTSKDCK